MKISKEVKVGLLATTALIIAYLGFSFLKGGDIFSSDNVYYTTYTNSAGLSTSSPVLVNGMPVGRVKNIQVLPNQGYSILVAFAINKDIILTDATEARLVNRSLLGGKAIDLLIEAGEPLKNYDTIPGQIEQGFGDAFMDTALPNLTNAKDISLLTGKFVASLVENTDRINSIFTNLEEIAHQLKKAASTNQKEINRVVKNMTKISNTLSHNENGIEPLLKKLNQLVGGLEGQEMRVAAKKVNNILGSLEQMLDKTGKEESSLSRLLEDDTLYKNLNQALVNLDQLLIDWKTYPGRYVNFSVFGKRQSREETRKK
ncbi:MAG: MlaD family protein [Bacteroidota bacterium]